MSLQKNAPTFKPKPAIPKRTTQLSSPLKSPTSGMQTTLKGFPNDKPERVLKTESSAVARAKSKEVTKTIPDGGVRMNTVSDFNESELSIIKMLEGDIQHDLHEDFEESKLLEEIAALRKDLSMKNNLVEKLVKENGSLKKEVDELLTTVEANKELLNTKVSGCNQRIQELEVEIKTLKSQNISYQEQLSKKDTDIASGTGMKELEDYVTKYYSDAKKGMDEFYKKLNQKISGFAEAPKAQGENPPTINLQNTSDDSKKDSGKKILKRADTQGTPDQRVGTRHSTTRTGSSISQPKGKFNANTPNAASSNFKNATGRVGAMSASNRRKKMITLYNFDDIMPIDKSEGNFVGGILNTNESVGRSPKNSLIQNNLAKELPKYEF